MRGPRLLALVLLALVAAPAGAQEPAPPLRPCRRADLLGHWLVLRFGFASDATVDRGDPAYQPYQRYVFNTNATMSYTASATPPGPEEERVLAQAPATATWAVDPGGRLRRQRDGAARVETSECRVVLRVVKDSRNPLLALPGDVVLTDQDEGARPIARRLLRKLPSAE
jgi:hypothetical protein